MIDAIKKIVLVGDITQKLMDNTHITDVRLATEIARRWIRAG